MGILQTVLVVINLMTNNQYVEIEQLPTPASCVAAATLYVENIKLKYPHIDKPVIAYCVNRHGKVMEEIR